MTPAQLWLHTVEHFVKRRAANRQPQDSTPRRGLLYSQWQCSRRDEGCREICPRSHVHCLSLGWPRWQLVKIVIIGSAMAVDRSTKRLIVNKVRLSELNNLMLAKDLSRRPQGQNAEYH
jgi:hypothetical protein